MFLLFLISFPLIFLYKCLFVLNPYYLVFSSSTYSWIILLLKVIHFLLRLIHTDISYILAGFTSVSLSGTCNFLSIFNKRAGGLFYQSHTHLLYLHTHKVHTHGPERSDKSDDGFDRSAALALQLSPGLHTHTYTHNSRWNCLYIKHPRHKPPPTHTYTHTYIYDLAIHQRFLCICWNHPVHGWTSSSFINRQGRDIRQNSTAH